MTTYLLLSMSLLAADMKMTTLAEIKNPYGLIEGPDGAVYVCSIDDHAIYRIDRKTAKITRVAPKHEMNEPYELRFDKAGNLFFVDMKRAVVEKLDKRTGKVSRVAGTGETGFSGDGGPADKAQLKQPHSIAFDPEGRLMICDLANHRVRRVDLKTGVIDTWIGGADNPIKSPRALDVDPQGQIWLASRETNIIYKVDGKSGALTPFAGTGKKGNTGDGGPALEATLNGPKGVVWSPDGWVYIADTENHSVRRINRKTGIVETVLKDLKRPHGVGVTKKGEILVGDSENHKVLILR